MERVSVSCSKPSTRGHLLWQPQKTKTQRLSVQRWVTGFAQHANPHLNSSIRMAAAVCLEWLACMSHPLKSWAAPTSGKTWLLQRLCHQATGPRSLDLPGPSLELAKPFLKHELSGTGVPKHKARIYWLLLWLDQTDYTGVRLTVSCSISVWGL